MEIPKGHYIFGTVKVGERGQIVIPREARDKFDIKAGDTLLVLGDEKWRSPLQKEQKGYVRVGGFALAASQGVSFSRCAM